MGDREISLPPIHSQFSSNISSIDMAPAVFCLEIDFTSDTHLHSCKSQAKAYGWIFLVKDFALRFGCVALVQTCCWNVYIYIYRKVRIIAKLWKQRTAGRFLESSTANLQNLFQSIIVWKRPGLALQKFGMLIYTQRRVCGLSWVCKNALVSPMAPSLKVKLNISLSESSICRETSKEVIYLFCINQVS